MQPAMKPTAMSVHTTSAATPSMKALETLVEGAVLLGGYGRTAPSTSVVRDRAKSETRCRAALSMLTLVLGPAGVSSPCGTDPARPESPGIARLLHSRAALVELPSATMLCRSHPLSTDAPARRASSSAPLHPISSRMVSSASLDMA